MSLGLYTVTFGRYNGRKLQDISLNDIWDYVTFLEESAAKEGKELSPKLVELKGKLGEYEALMGAKGEKPGWRKGQGVGSGKPPKPVAQPDPINW